MARATATGGRPATAGVIPGRWALSVGKPPWGPPDGFEWTLLSDVARLETGHTPSRRHPAYWDGDVPWVGIRDATANHGRVIYETNQTITELGLDNSSARLLPEETVCLSRTASVGYVVMMGRPMATSQDFVNWVCGPRVLPRYLLYVLVAEQSSIRRFAHGTTHQTLYFPEAKALNLSLPSLSTQHGIVEVLGALDAKIEANLRLAKSLHNLALAVGSRECARAAGPLVTLSSVAEVTKGISYRSEDLVPGTGWLVGLKCVGRKGGFRYDGLKPYSGPAKESQLLATGDVIVAHTDLTQRAEVIGRPLRLPSLPVDGVLVASLDFVIVRPRQGLTREMVMAILSTQDFRDHALSYCNGTTVLHMSAQALPSYAFAMPASDAVSNATEIMAPLLARSDSAILEAAVLGELRDILLPRLLSGRIRVADAEGAVEGLA